MTSKFPEQKVRLESVRVGGESPSELKAAVARIAGDLKRLGDAHDKHDDQMSSALRGGLSIENNAKMKLKNVRIELPADAPWLPLTLAGTWAQAVSFQAPEYLMEPGGKVSTRGDVDSGSAGHVADLPEGYGPASDTHFPAGADTDTTSFLLVIPGTPTGLYLSGSTGLYSLSASWLAKNAAMPHAFAAPWPVIVDHGLAKCEGLVCEGCIEETSGVRTTTGVPLIDWEDIGGGQLRLNGVWGLQWGKRYKLRLRLSAEKAEE